MITEEMKTKIVEMTPEERHELSSYLLKLELENDPEYWKVVCERAAKEDQSWVNVEVA